MSKHTPGPWQIFEPSGLSENFLIAFVEHDADDEGRHKSWLTRICEMSDTDDEEANANLISAAPELAEALQRMVSRYIADGGERLLPEFQAATAALAKAGVT